jgi:transposase
MYYGQESLLPIFYCTYKGSIVDKSHLPYMMQYNKELGIKEVCFVMDRGFFSEGNVRELAFKHRFIMGIWNSLVLSKEIIEKHGQQVMSSRHDIGLSGVKGLAIEDERYGFRSKIHLFYSNDKIADEERYLKSKLSDWEKELGKGKSVKVAEEYFQVTGSVKEKDLVVRRKHDAIDEKIRNMGYFLMMTTDLNKTPEEILFIYRQKDVIEKCFDELKNDLDMKRLRVHSDVAMQGKMFIAFIGLILRTYVHNKLRDYVELNRPISMPQIYDEMRMVKTVKTKSGMIQHNPLTKKQRQILEEFGVTEELLASELRNYAGMNSYFDN